MTLYESVCRVCGRTYSADREYFDKHGGSIARKHLCSFDCFRVYVGHEEEYSDEGVLVHENYLRWRKLYYLLARRKGIPYNQEVRRKFERGEL